MFNAASGQTHFTNEIAAVLLRTLIAEQHSNGSLSYGKLCDRLGETLNMELDDELYDYIDELLNSLDELGLIMCQRPSQP